MKTKYLPTYVSLYNMAFVFVVFQERFAPVYLPRFIHLEKGEGGGGGGEGDSAPGWKDKGCSPENFWIETSNETNLGAPRADSEETALLYIIISYKLVTKGFEKEIRSPLSDVNYYVLGNII